MWQYKRSVAFVLCVVLLVHMIQLDAYAGRSTIDNEKTENIVGEVGGYLAANKITVRNLRAEAKFSTETGHGWAAERANNLSDVFKGKNAKVVGDNNVKNGASPYSRYNLTSAMNTIRSLPDTSAYLATAGGTNTIKFNRAAGSATSGGGISSLSTSDIAIATAKGWTVSLV